MNNPLVSIVMPTYNRADLIGRSIQSVLAQTYENFEFIIINDCSTDITEEIIQGYVEKDQRIVSLKNETNLKIVRSLNRGLKVAKGKYIARIDDDDVWIDRQKLEEQVEFLEKNSDYVIVGTGNISVLKSQGVRMYSLKPETDGEIRENILIGCPFLHPAVVYRHEAAKNLGFYDESLPQAEDYDLWMKFGKVGKMHNLPIHAIESLVGATNIGHLKRAEIIKYNLKLIKKYRKDYPHYTKAYFKNSILYIDASFPIFRKLLWPVYKIRRFILNKKVKIEKI